MSGLQSELQQLRSRFEESLSSRETSEKRLNEQIRDVSLHRHEAQQEVRPTVLNQSLDRIINSFVLSLTWKKASVGQESKYFVSWEADLFALEGRNRPRRQQEACGSPVYTN